MSFLSVRYVCVLPLAPCWVARDTRAASPTDLLMHLYLIRVFEMESKLQAVPSVGTRFWFAALLLLLRVCDQVLNTVDREAACSFHAECGVG